MQPFALALCLAFFLCLATSCVVFSCKRNITPNAVPGTSGTPEPVPSAAFTGTSYFEGLSALRNDNLAQAKAALAKSRTSDHPLLRPLAESLLLSFAETNAEFSREVQYAKKHFADNDTVRESLVERYASADKWKEILRLVPEHTENACLEMWRLQALAKTTGISPARGENGKKQDVFWEEALRFALMEEFSEHHVVFCATCLEPISAMLTAKEESVFTHKFPAFAPTPKALATLAQARLLVYRRKYASAYETFLNYLSGDTTEAAAILATLPAPLYADVSTAFLYASPQKPADALLFENALKYAQDFAPSAAAGTADSALLRRAELAFTAAQFYRREGTEHFPHAEPLFLEALAAASALAPTGGQDSDPQNTAALYDRILWYYLDTAYKNSPTRCLELLPAYAPTWHDPAYFDDLMENMCAWLCQNHRWKRLYETLETLGAWLSPAMRVQYTYICARAIEEGLLPETVPARTLMESAYNTQGGSLYYRMLLAEKLGCPLEIPATSAPAPQAAPARTESPAPVTPAARAIPASQPKTAPKATPASQPKAAPAEPVVPAEQTSALTLQDLLLAGYAHYGFFDRILPLCRATDTAFDRENARAALTVFAQHAQQEPEYAAEALRSASYALDWDENNPSFTAQDLELLFPRYYQAEITGAADEYALPPALLYALVRTESYFDAGVYSAAGATGLTQLMPATAGDVARKMRVEDYDLHNAETNARFGAFYLAELVRRLDGNELLAVLSYNAGINRVRQWVRQSPGLPLDLFLETVPYQETRTYGKRVSQAACLYALLYNGEPYFLLSQ